jgi:LPXTG-motif cell wall-anchored protein
MNLLQPARKPLYRLLAIGAICPALAVVAMAQVTTTSSTKLGAGTHQAQVERGEVVYVSGNDVVVKMENGEVRHVTVPEGAKATVDGKEITIKDLKPGMKLQRTITTTTTPKLITTVRTIQGKVWAIQPPTTVILAMPEGNRQFKIPKGQKFMVDGKEVTAFDIKKGMTISATVITQVPETVVAQSKKVTGSAPPPPPTPPMEGALLIEEPAKPAPVAAAPAPEPAVAAAEPAPKKLPKTGSVMPLIGLLGLLSCGLSFGIRMFRR